VRRRLTRRGGRRRRCGWVATLRRPAQACRPPTGRAAMMRAAPPGGHDGQARPGPGASGWTRPSPLSGPPHHLQRTSAVGCAGAISGGGLARAEQESPCSVGRAGRRVVTVSQPKNSKFQIINNRQAPNIRSSSRKNECSYHVQLASKKWLPPPPEDAYKINSDAHRSVSCITINPV